MKNPKTTIGGYVIIAASILYVVGKFLTTGTITADDLKMVTGGLAIGGIGVAAADGGH